MDLLLGFVAGWFAAIVLDCVIWRFLARDVRRQLERDSMVALARRYSDADGRTLDEWLEEVLS
jgi:hypothetical protein